MLYKSVCSYILQSRSICYHIDFHSLKWLLPDLTSPPSANRIPPSLRVPCPDWPAAYSQGWAFTASLPPPAPAVFDHCDLIKQPYATVQSEALIRLCDWSVPLPRKEGSWVGVVRVAGGGGLLAGFGVGVMWAGDTVKPSGNSFVTSWKCTSTLWFLTASVGHEFMTCGL